MVKLRSKTRKAPEVTELIVEGVPHTGDDVIKGWATQQKGIADTSTEQLKKAIKQLNINKAADINGLVTEHLKYSPNSVLDAVTMAINHFTRNEKFPDVHKSGVLFPAHKKLETSNPFNHRGITVVDLFCKLYELALKDSSDPVLLPTQSKMQRGFTKDTPALCSGLMFQEQIYQAKMDNKPLYVILLDVKTAFDVVWHDSLMKKLHQDGIDGDLWLAKKILAPS